MELNHSTFYCNNYHHHLSVPTCSHLVSEASAAAVDHNAHLTFVVDSHLLGGVVVVDLIHHLDLSVVVSCSQSPQLKHTKTPAL